MGLGFNNARQVVSVLVTDPAADDQRVHMFRVPSNIRGEIVSANIVCQDAQGSGSAGTFELQNWGTAGTAIKATGGTVAAGLGGTAVAARLSAETPAAYTITEGTLLENEWVVVDYQEDTAWVETAVLITVEVQWGIGADV